MVTRSVLLGSALASPFWVWSTLVVYTVGYMEFHVSGLQGSVLQA